MPPKELSQPFLTREMLAFEQGQSFGILIEILTDVQYTLTLKGITKEGPFQYNIKTTGSHTKDTFQFTVPDVPIMLTVELGDVGILIAYVKIKVYLTINKSKYAVLMQGNLNGADTLSWPNQLPITEIQKRGSFEIRASADPAAGAEINAVTSASEWMKLQYVEFTLVAAIAAANRRVVLAISGYSGGVILVPVNVTQIATETKKYIFYDGAQNINDTVNNIIVTPLPKEIWLHPGTTIQTITGNLNAADNYSVALYSGEIYYNIL